MIYNIYTNEECAFARANGWACAMERREPCQAGTRAALSGLSRVPQSTRLFVRTRAYFVLWGERMYRALYRKYRPSCFSDVCGQEHITVTLKNQLKNGAVSHAYLFTGPRGTGKTSCAKIFAKAVNCLEPKDGDACTKCASCLSIDSENNLDITEIDAASNNGVDNIRDLRNNVNYTPANSKYRVYIIDEVHMLSSGAFNALLKTLEEPPAHAIFILATTEVHKLPATVISRCQRYDFRRLDPDVIKERLLKVARSEGINLSDSAAAFISNLCDGGMRDALSMLDLCAAYSNDITDEVVCSSCAVAGKDRLFELVDAISAENTGEALRLADGLWKDSVDMQRLCTELVSHFRNLLIYKTVKDPKGLVVATAKESESYKAQSQKFSVEFIMLAIRVLGDALGRMTTANRRAELEGAIIKLTVPSLQGGEEALISRIEALERKIANGSLYAEEKPEFRPAKKKAEPPKAVREEEDIPLPEENESPAPLQEEEAEENPIEKAEVQTEDSEEKPLAAWGDILKELGKTCPLLVGVLNGSSAYIKGNYLLIDYKNDQFLKFIGQPVYKDYIKKAAFSVLGKNYNLGPYGKRQKDESADLLDTLTGRLNDLGIPSGK